MKHTAPPFIPRTMAVKTLYTRIGSHDEIAKLLEIDKGVIKKWRNTVPPPYADRIYLSEWFTKEYGPRYVMTEDALIIFKKFKPLAEHFGRKKTWKENMIFLPEVESAYMLHHFGTYMREFLRHEINPKYLP